MVLAEDLAVFFNADEFGTPVTINGKEIIGLFNYSTILVNEVETRKPIFICAEADAQHVAHGSLVRIQKQNYQIIGIKPDGIGLVTYILESVSAL